MSDKFSKTENVDAISNIQKTASMQRASSESLFVNRRELIIEHEGEEYRLRKTSKGKLILTK